LHAPPTKASDLNSGDLGMASSNGKVNREISVCVANVELRGSALEKTLDTVYLDKTAIAIHVYNVVDIRDCTLLAFWSEVR
jgi:hypothetical protein